MAYRLRQRLVLPPLLAEGRPKVMAFDRVERPAALRQPVKRYAPPQAALPPTTCLLAILGVSLLLWAFIIGAVLWLIP